MKTEFDFASHPDDSDWMPFLYGECDESQMAILQDHLKHCSHCAAKIAGWKSVQSKLDAWTLGSPVTSGSPAMASGRLTASTTSCIEQPVRQARPEPTASARSQSVPGSVGRSRQSVLTAAAVLLALTAAFLAGWQVSNAKQPDLLALRKELASEIRGELMTDVRKEMQNQIQTLNADKARLTPLIESESERIISARLANLQPTTDPAEKLKERQMISDILENQIALRNDLEKLAVEAESQIIRTRRELLRLEAVTRTGSSEGIQPLNGKAPQF